MDAPKKQEVVDDIDSSEPLDWSRAARGEFPQKVVAPHDGEEIDSGAWEEMHAPRQRETANDTLEEIDSCEARDWHDSAIVCSLTRKPEDAPREFLKDEIEDEEESAAHVDEVIDEYSESSEGEIVREPISDGVFVEHAHEPLEAIDAAGVFKQERVVLEFLEDETSALDLWDFGYSRVLKVNVVDSQIPGFPEGVVRLIVQAGMVPHVRQVGDKFVLAEPFHAFVFGEQMYIMAPSVSDRC